MPTFHIVNSLHVFQKAFSQTRAKALLHKSGQLDIHRQKQTKVKLSHFTLHNISFLKKEYLK